MAKKTPEAQSTAVATTAPQALADARPEWMNEHSDTSGSDHITKDDIQLPRMVLAQAMSPQLDTTSDKYIEDLKQGQAFNNVTREVLHTPISFAIIRADRPRFIEFNPRASGGGVKDPDVPANDPRTQFTLNEETGERIPPIATKFYDYVIVMLPFTAETAMDMTIVLSMKSSQLKIARQLNTLIQTRKVKKEALYLGKYTLNIVSETNTKGKFFNYAVKNDGWVSQEQASALKKMAELFADKVVAFDRDDHTDDEPTEG